MHSFYVALHECAQNTLPCPVSAFCAVDPLYGRRGSPYKREWGELSLMAARPSPRLHHTFIFHVVNHPSDMAHWHRDSLMDAQASWLKPGAPALLSASVQQYCPLLLLYTRRLAADPAPLTEKGSNGSRGSV